GSLRTRPFERLLYLGARGIRQLGRLVSRLLEQAVRTSFSLTDLGGRLPLDIGLGLTCFIARAVQHLGALALALLTEPLDLVLALLQLALATGDLFLGASKLSGRSGLSVSLDRVGHVCGGADHVQRVHPHCVTR